MGLGGKGRFQPILNHTGGCCGSEVRTMLLDGVWSLLSRHGHPGPETARTPVEPPPEAAAPPDDDDPVWPSTRIAVAEALWGEGFLFPGGSAGVVHLAKPLGLSDASSLLVVGAGTGGPSRRIAAELGVWVNGYEANPRLIALANERSQRAGLGRRAQVEPWDPDTPKFPPRYFHHGLTIDVLRLAPAQRVLPQLAQALKPGGQLVLLETVADLPLDPADATAATWARLDHRLAPVPGELEVTRQLRSLGFDVRIVEDLSARHMHDAIAGWTAAVQAMVAAPPPPRVAAALVREAELWMSRLRLMQAGRIRLVRWHAIGG
jgi:SAM-dependent methyltransferase